MRLMCDAISVLGSRHGLVLEPVNHCCRIVRYDGFERMLRFELKAGIVVNGEKVVLPLTAEGKYFDFHDQNMTPCSMSMTGIHADSGVKLKLTIVTPFRPRDPDFSTMPILAIKLEARQISGRFRWRKRTMPVDKVEVFAEFAGDDIVARAERNGLNIEFDSVARIPSSGEEEAIEKTCGQRDRIVAYGGDISAAGAEFVKTVDLNNPSPLSLAWCKFDIENGLRIQGADFPFRYTRRFSSLDDVCDFARNNLDQIFENAARVDALIANNTCGEAINKLLAYTLHSWLINTWWIDRGGQEWFSVWEGVCEYHSTVDVEYTQSPFYLAVWPELLGIELNIWPEYSKDGTASLGRVGDGTLFPSHDVGSHSAANGQMYPHEMEVEETANYLIMVFAHWRRTGDDSIIKTHIETIVKYLKFLRACDTTGNGIPDQGVANTVDDASPAIQFGREQIYLAVKTMAAFRTGAEILRSRSRAGEGAEYDAMADGIGAVIEEKGWAGDHFVTLLDKSAKGLKNPWDGSPLEFDEVPGWDSAHIYTANGLAPLDMVGFKIGLDEDKIKADLENAAKRCVSRYGCTHSDYIPTAANELNAIDGLAGDSGRVGWISMNMLRDIAAFYRRIDLRDMAGKYWDWQMTANSQEPKIFFETFYGNNLCFYPRGVVVWGFFDALNGRVLDKVAGIDALTPAHLLQPDLLNAKWD